jgi:WD40 repeat protein
MSLMTLVGAKGQMNVLAPLSNSLLASVGADKNVLIWNTSNGTLIKNLTGPGTQGVSLVGLLIFRFVYKIGKYLSILKF